MRPLSAALISALAVTSVTAGSSAQVAPAAPQSAGGDAGPQPTVQSSQAYRLRQGDEILLTVFGEPTLTPPGPLHIAQGGAVEIPLVGAVMVGGLTTSAAGLAISKSLHRYVRDPRVTVAVYSVGPIEALVLGNVKTPGKYTLPNPARLTDVLAAAGGLGPTDGDLPAARLEQPSGKTSNVSLQSLLHDGDETQNVQIESGETVYIPSPAIFNVIVSGAVEKAGDVVMHEGDDIVVAVARAGSSSALRPDLNRVAIKRVGADGKAISMTVNLYPIIKDGDQTHDVKMQKGDIVFVPTSPNHLSGSDLLFSALNHVPY